MLNALSVSLIPNNQTHISGECELRLNFFELLKSHRSNCASPSKKRINPLRLEIRNQIHKLEDLSSFEFCSIKEDQRALTRDMVQHWRFSRNEEPSLLEAFKDFFAAWAIEKQGFVAKGLITIGSRSLVKLPTLVIPEAGSRALITRVGNVELRAIDAISQSGSEVEAFVKFIQSQKLQESFMYSPSESIHQYSNDDFGWAIRLLMTNAGMYFPIDLRNGFELLRDWKDKYVAAILQSDFTIDKGDLAIAPHVLSQIYKERNMLDSQVKFNGKNFLNGLSGHTIVFATPFAKQINQLFNGGKIPDLYGNFKLPQFRITAFEAPISTWPNRPDGDWGQTFQKLIAASLDSIERNNATLFLASCGSYGLPLCREIHTRTKLVSIYTGHVPNNLLGVMSGRINNIGGLSVNKSAFLPSHLSNVPNVARIDGGGYV
jgi:hypothetical protein